MKRKRSARKKSELPKKQDQKLWQVLETSLPLQPFPSPDPLAIWSQPKPNPSTCSGSSLRKPGIQFRRIDPLRSKHWMRSESGAFMIQVVHPVWMMHRTPVFIHCSTEAHDSFTFASYITEMQPLYRIGCFMLLLKWVWNQKEGKICPKRNGSQLVHCNYSASNGWKEIPTIGQAKLNCVCRTVGRLDEGAATPFRGRCVRHPLPGTIPHRMETSPHSPQRSVPQLLGCSRAAWLTEGAACPQGREGQPILLLLHESSIENPEE